MWTRVRDSAVIVIVLVLTFQAVPLARAAVFRDPSPVDDCLFDCRDTTPPALTISSPASGALANEWITIAGSATDDDRVSAVLIRHGTQTTSVRTHSGSWSTILNTTALPQGTNEIVVDAVDPSGNLSSQTVSVIVDWIRHGVPEPAPTGGVELDPVPEAMEIESLEAADAPLEDDSFDAPADRGPLGLHGQDDLLRAHGWVGLVALDDPFSPALHLRDGDGVTAIVPLHGDDLVGWSDIAVSWPTREDLYVVGATDRAFIRRYRVAWDRGEPVGADLLGTKQVSDGPARVGDLITLSSGRSVLAWYDLDARAQVQHISSWLPGRSLQEVDPFSFVAGEPADQALVEQPTDGSVWLLSTATGSSRIGAAAFIPTDSGLTVSWGDAAFISPDRHLLYAADPGAPSLTATADPASGSIVIGYPSADRGAATTADGVASSRLALARISSDGAITFTHGPDRVPAGSDVAVLVHDGVISVASFLMGEGDEAADELVVRTFDGTDWADLERYEAATGIAAARSGRHIAIAGTGTIRFERLG